MGIELNSIVKLANSTYRYDQIIKTLAFGFGSFSYLFDPRKQSKISKSLDQLGSHMNMARYILRFTGFIESLDALKNGTWNHEDDTLFRKKLVKLQNYSMILYYPFEYIAYINYIAPKLFEGDADKYTRRSCVMWSIYILLDLYLQILRYRSLNKKKVDLKEEKIKNEKRMNDVKWGMIRNVLFLPTAIHWSLKKGLISPSLVQYLSFAEAMIGLWRSYITIKQ